MKQSKAYVVVRDFRGDTLYLVKVQRAALTFEWSNSSAAARRFETMAGAMAAASLASREYSALCVVRDAAGCLAQSAAAAGAVTAHKHDARGRPIDAEPVGVATCAEFKRIVTAAVSDHGPHCAEHAGFTDGCAACYSVHAERAA